MPSTPVIISAATFVVTTVLNWLIFQRNFSLRQIEVEAEAQNDTSAALKNYLDQVLGLQNMVTTLSERLNANEQELSDRMRMLEDYSRRISDLEAKNIELESLNQQQAANIASLQQELLSFTQA